MRLRSLALPLLLASAYLPSPGLAQHLATNETGECRDVQLARRPGWAISGGFTADGSQLRLVDSLYWTILRYGEAGESLGPIDDPIKKTVRSILPVTGKARGQDFILEGADGLLLMDKNLRPTATKRMPSDPKGWTVTSLWEWQPVGRNDIVGFADIGHGIDPTAEGSSETAFVRFSLQDPGELHILGSRFPISGTQNKGYFRSTYTYITSLGEAAYYLSFNDGIKLYKQEGVGAPEDKSVLLPRGLNKAPLPDWHSRTDLKNMMKDIEGASMPVGLFGWRDSKRDWLFLLYRTPQGSDTRWIIYRIDPTGKLPVSSADLPIRANHVTVIPGPKEWAILEKGPVVKYGVQETSRILYVPSRLLMGSMHAGSSLCN
jgi:hypothetical protein